MAKQNGNIVNGNGTSSAPQEALPVPSIEELRRIFEQGLPQKLLSGIEVQMRPVSPDRLLQLGRVPDILTPIMLKGLYGDVRPDLDEFAAKKRDEKAETLEFIRAVDVVCEAALIDPSIVPYLPLSDRLWIFKLAFMPAAVLSTFRLQPKRNVDTVDDQPEDGQPTERADVLVEPAGRVPV